MAYADPEKQRENARKWREANPEKHRENARKWQEANPEKHREYARKYYAANTEKLRERNRKYREANTEKQRERVREWREANPEKHREHNRKWRAVNKKALLIMHAKSRAKSKNLPFDLTPDDLEWPEYCPVLGIKLDYNSNKHNMGTAPSLDRWDNAKGYTPDNVCVISMKANLIKNNATAEELEKIAAYARNPTECGWQFALKDIL